MSAGPVNQYATRLQQVATKVQLRQDVESELEEAVQNTVTQAKALRATSGPEFLNAVAGRLKMEAAACEAPDERLPNKGTDSTLNMGARIDILRRVAEKLKTAAEHL